MVRILLIDDHALFRDAVTRALAAESDFEISGSCASVEEGVEILRHRIVDIVLLDINLGSEQGGAIRYAEAFEVCEYGTQPSKEELRKLFPFFEGR